MNYKKIIPCLDVKDGRVVKGVNFVNFRDAGDPVENAKYYCSQGADELVFLDITATHEKRKTIVALVEKVAKEVTVPFAVGGGIKTVEDIQDILNAGADKVGINSAAVLDKSILAKAAEKFGSERIVLAIDAQMIDGKYRVIIDGGRKNTGIDAIEWAIEGEKLGAGEILLTSVDTDGMKNGYDLVLTKLITDAINIPVTASGGCGKLEHFYDAFEIANADAALAATLFHFKELTIMEVKNYLKERGVNVKLV
ncbi:MAG: imidazole glycerol phosphate synthase subunit HisF [Oscillospiraceae bacterium]|nr:imidazole glycerol phosphate synthase subunit HisF [Oscillospiraceae bacterium]